MVPTPLQRMRFSPLCFIVSDTHEPRRIDQVDVAGRVETVPEGMDLQILLNNLNSEIETLKAQQAEEEEAQEQELQKAMQHIAGSAAGGTGNVLVPEVDYRRMLKHFSQMQAFCSIHRFSQPFTMQSTLLIVHWLLRAAWAW